MQKHVQAVPSRSAIALPGIRAVVDGEDYQKCDVASSGFWINNYPDRYGKGFINSRGDPHKATRLGLIGEVAFGRMVGLTPDMKYKNKGDDGEDFVINGLKLDTKTASKPGKEMLVYRINARGKTLEIKSDIYIAQYIEREDREKQEAVVVTVGWITREELLQCPLVQSKVNIHYNLVADYGRLRPIRELFEVLHHVKPKL